MMLAISGAAGLPFAADLGFVTAAMAEEATPVAGPSPEGKGAPTDGGQQDAIAGAHSPGAVGNAEQAESHEKGAFPPFNGATYPSQILWLVIIFGLFYLFLKRVVLPQVGGIIETRKGRIGQDLEHANRLKTEADAAVAAYEQALAEARANANRIGQEARDKAKADAEAERKRVEQGLDTKLAEAQARIEGIKSSAMGEVGGIASETAEAIVKALTGADPDRGAIDAAVSSARS